MTRSARESSSGNAAPTVIGVDVGGANLKLAHSDGVAKSAPFDFWRNPDGLKDRLNALADELPSFDRVAVTMTAELCDCFETKRQGVASIVASILQWVGDSRPIHAWTVDGRWVELAEPEASTDPLALAASNWHALATWSAQYLARTFGPEPGLLLDIGSTTTDIIAIADGRVKSTSRSDTDRLATGELVYLGTRRTPIMAIAKDVVIEGSAYPLMAEHFATTDDLFLMGDQLIEGVERWVRQDPSDCATADGRPRTHAFAIARLLRMIGHDIEGPLAEKIDILATDLLNQMLATIRLAIAGVEASPKRILLSGSGAFLGHNVVKPLGADVICLRDVIGETASDAGCAFSVMAMDHERVGGNAMTAFSSLRDVRV